jgi:hypothetical protein
LARIICMTKNFGINTQAILKHNSPERYGQTEGGESGDLAFGPCLYLSVC